MTERPNGMQGSWTRPPLSSPVRPAVLSALPSDGSIITRAELIAKVREACPTHANATIVISDLARRPASGVVRAGHGLYQRE